MNYYNGYELKDRDIPSIMNDMKLSPEEEQAYEKDSVPPKPKSKSQLREEREDPHRILTFEDVFTEENMYNSYMKVRSGKKKRRKVILYNVNILHELNMLYDNLHTGTYKIGPLSQFKVYEPKERAVVANLFEDKIVQDIMAKKVLRPILAPKLIFDNYASQPGKGTHLALKRLERNCRIFAKSTGWTDEGWVMVGDISKFFYTIDHTVMWDMLKDLPIDDKLKWILKTQIDICDASMNPYTDDDTKGLCIGFQTSQWMAVYYLNGLDHFIKEKLHIKCYGRYMDDFYLIHEDRKYLEHCFDEIQNYLETELKVTMNKKSYIHPFRQGICFLGYHTRYDPTTRKVYSQIRSKSINKMLKRARWQKGMIWNGTITPRDAQQSLQSWMAYAKHGNTNKAKNAHDMASKMLADPVEQAAAECRELRRDWRNVDPEGFYVLREWEYNPKEEGSGARDEEGFYKLIPRRKPSKKEVWAEGIYERQQSNPETAGKRTLEDFMKYTPKKLDKPEVPSKRIGALRSLDRSLKAVISENPDAENVEPQKGKG